MLKYISLGNDGSVKWSKVERCKSKAKLLQRRPMVQILQGCATCINV